MHLHVGSLSRQADESFYSPDFFDFLHVLAERRAQQGIPLSVVMLGPHDGRRNMEVKPSWQGYAGFRVRSIDLPSSHQILDKFWNKLWIEKGFPLLFPSTVLASMERSYWYQQGSAHRTLSKMQQVLAYYFSQKGSFLSVTSHKKILSELWQRIAWFLVTEEARGVPIGETDTSISSTRMLQALEELEIRQQTSQFVLQLVDSFRNVNNQKNRKESGRYSTTLFHPTSSFSLQHMKRKHLLEQLMIWKKKIDDGPDRRDFEPTHRTLISKYVQCVPVEQACSDSMHYEKQQLCLKQKILNELIVLVGNCRDGDNLSEIEQHLNEILARWIFHRADKDLEFSVEEQEELSSLVQYQWAWSSQPPEYDWGFVAESLSPEPRSQTLSALLRSSCDLGLRNGRPNDLSLTTIAGKMYQLIQDRVAATQEDWYKEFWQRSIRGGAECSREDSFVLFSLGLRYLKQCGFIAEKVRVGSKSDIIYERSKLVWCGV